MGIRNLLALTGLGALTAVIAILTPTMTHPSVEPDVPVAAAAPPTTSTAVAGVPVTDDRGFLDSAARCPAGQTAAAAGRTRRSQVVICADGDQYSYRGVRIADDATLELDAETSDDGFVAHTDGATYTVTPTELVVVSGGKVIYRDTWIDYAQPANPAAG